MKRKKLTEFILFFLTFVIAASLSLLIFKNLPEKAKNDGEPAKVESAESIDEETKEKKTEEETKEKKTEVFPLITNATSSNCTIKYGYLMLINPNFHVEDSFIATRRTELISLVYNYGIKEANPNNGDNLMDSVAALHLNEMLNAYKAEYPGHEMMTRSCFRSKGTSCGRLCLATGTTDHHTGLTCDLIDQTYGSSLDTSLYSSHKEWQWLKQNSYKYGFIDRFPVEWAGGSMNEPINVDNNGSTGLYETWHYRYVGVDVATEIATGKYNNGKYDSLEHYLKARGLVTSLTGATCN